MKSLTGLYTCVCVSLKRKDEYCETHPSKSENLGWMKELANENLYIEAAILSDVVDPFSNKCSDSRLCKVR